MIMILGNQQCLYLQLIIILITFAMALYDFYTERISNKINLILFGVMLVVGFQLNQNVLLSWSINLLSITAIGFTLFLLGVLGGGDCKYLIALSPVIDTKTLLVVLGIGMCFFVVVYMMKQLFNAFFKQEIPVNLKLVTGKMPFLWAMIPGFMATSLFGIG